MIEVAFLQNFLWQDLAIALGSFIGVITKLYALWDSETVWTRRSSGVNILFYPPSLAAFLSLNLYLTFATTFTSFLIWIGIYIFRAPSTEDWIGRRQ